MKIDNLEILNGLIAGAEGGTVEFKETTGQLERGIETLCAFLNGTGGTVLFGVTDKGKIIGQEYILYRHSGNEQKCYSFISGRTTIYAPVHL